MYLAELGAEVIKIESAGRPDIPTRELNFAENEPGELPWERAAFFHRLNVGKLDITLDLTRAEGVELFKRLVATADVVAENYNPATMERFGLGWGVLSSINPRLIMVSMSGFGATGPRRSWAAYYPAMEAMSGLTSVTGYADEELNSATGYGDWILGTTGAAAVLVALHQRGRTGEGQYIDVSGREAALVGLADAVLDYGLNQRRWGAVGNRHTSMAPHDTYRCEADRWVAIAVRDEADWRAFCGVLGEPAWTREARFGDPLSRWEHQDEMRPYIEAWTASRSHRGAAEELLRAGVPAGPVLDPREVLLDAHFQARRYFEVIEHPVVGKRVYPRQLAAHFSAMPAPSRRPPPLLGEHNEEVLGGLLGLSAEELARLEEEGLIGKRPSRAARRPPQPSPFEELRRRGAEIDEGYRETLSAAFGVAIGTVSGQAAGAGDGNR